MIFIEDSCSTLRRMSSLLDSSFPGFGCHMNNDREIAYETMSVEELQAELKRLKDNLCDLEETHDFTFGKTTVHIGAERAQAMQEEYEEECALYGGQIAKIEGILKVKGG
jgi:hypothetical protein